MKEKDINSLEHTKWRCQYHIVFAPKYRRQAIYKEIKTDIGKILRKLCEQKGVNIIEAAGSSNSAIKLTLPELEKYSNYLKWVDVTKLP